MPPTVKRWFVKQYQRMKLDDANGIKPTRFLNKDTAATPLAKATFNAVTFSAYWGITGINAASWAIGSSNLATGLTIPEVFCGVLAGAFMIGFIAFLCGEPGVRYGVSFPMMSRAAFGIYGSYFVVLTKLLVNCVLFGIQAFWGAQAIRVIINALCPSFMKLADIVPHISLMGADEFIALVIYLMILFPLLLIPPHRLTSFMRIAFAAVVMSVCGMLFWALQPAKDYKKKIHHDDKVVTDRDHIFGFLQCFSAVGGWWVGNAFRQSDWTRFARSRKAPAIAQMVAAPLTITFTALIGTFVANEVRDRYGVQTWQPTEILAQMQSMEYTAGMRVGTFFAGVGWLFSQLSINLVHNSVAAGMDLSSMIPEVINIRRGAVVIVILGIATSPWRLVRSPATFIVVMSAFGTFTAPLAGILIADFWWVRKASYNVEELYMANSRYWYCYGFNYRAFMAWFLAMWPSIPGFLAHVVDVDDRAYVWHYVFQLTFIVGLTGGFFWYMIMCFMFPLRDPTDGETTIASRASIESSNFGDTSSETEDYPPTHNQF